MEDSKWAIAVRAVAVFIFGRGRFGMNKPILVKWRWNTLTQRFLQVVRNTKKALYLGVKLQVRQQKKRKLRRRTRRTMKKSLVLPLHYVPGVEEAEVWLGVECRQGDSSAVWGQLQGKVECKVRGFSLKDWNIKELCQALEGSGRGTWRTKKGFSPTRGGRSRTKNPKGRMFKVY